MNALGLGGGGPGRSATSGQDQGLGLTNRGNTSVGAPRRPSKCNQPFTPDDFRKELVKIMPGYKWTVHRASKDAVRLVATGIQSSGFNRLSTLEVERTTQRDTPWYRVKSAGFGTRAKWAGEVGDRTLARALRDLQEHYTRQSNHYAGLARSLQAGRSTPPQPEKEG